ncbi:ABC transporter permease [Nocardioides bruguierae]|uniref:Autoinducer 2 import system permease protein LsrC n=1 Tax=Nocardioides bruguierae TaxID=2945102 RepID=A0A9X2IEB0_9ACTN|nr:ABC transporter permease [Nocardioides bruguierae]MCM0620646.1 ABC transporter permease [Nocardioides bruguierae]
MSATLVQPSKAGLLSTILRSRELAIAVVLVALVLVATAKTESFLFSADGWRNVLLNPAMLVVLAIGQACVIITRSVDLSVGSTLGLTAYFAGRLFIDFPSLPIVVVVLLAVLLGALLGLVNGVLVSFAKVPALVITLGTMYIYRGIFLTWAGSSRITADQIPRSFSQLGTQQIVTIPVLTIVALAVLGVAAYFLSSTRPGRELYAIGSDPDAADLYGLPVLRRVLLAFVASGALAGLAGVMFLARYGTVSSQAGQGIELQAVGAAVIGGVAIFGGSGSALGAAVGAYLLVTINSVLPILGISDFWQQAVVGALILGAIALDRFLSLRQDAALVAARDQAPPSGGGGSPGNPGSSAPSAPTSPQVTA